MPVSSLALASASAARDLTRDSGLVALPTQETSEQDLLAGLLPCDPPGPCGTWRALGGKLPLARGAPKIGWPGKGESVVRGRTPGVSRA